MIRPGGSWIALATFVAALGCGGDDGAGPRGSASVVYEDRPVDCAGAFPDCQVGKLFITDVRVDGDRVGVLLLHEGARTIELLLSDDRGTTWRQAGLGGDLIAQYAYHGGRLQLVLYQGRAWLWIQTAEEVGVGVADRTRIAEWDLAAGRLGPLDGDAWLGESGIIETGAAGRLTMPVDSSDVRGGPVSRTMRGFDLATFTASTVHPLCEGGPCENTWWYSPDRGREWQAFGARPTLSGVPGQACRYLYRYIGATSTTPYGELHCVPWAAWPAAPGVGSGEVTPIFPVGGGPMHLIAAEGGRSVARTIVGDQVSAPIDLGPGPPGNMLGFSGRPRFGWLGAIQRPSRAGEIRTLVRIRDGVGEEVDVPAYPCDAPCGDDRVRSDYGTLRWLEPMGDEYLAFWHIDRDLGDIRQEVFYAERVTPRFGPIRDDGLPPPPPPVIPGHPNARPATELIGACARVELCGLGQFDRCIVSHGSNTLHAPADRHGARQALIAAAAGGCAALAAALPSGCTDACIAAGGICPAGGGCDLGPPEDPATCVGRPVGAYCSAGRVVNCDSAGGATVVANCAVAGVECADPSAPGTPGTARCQVPRPCDATCAGDTFTSCDGYVDCGDSAQVCSLQGCTYSEPAPEDARCIWGTDVPICAGDYVLHCIGDWRHYTSCTDLGFSTCTDIPGGAQCAP